MKTYRPRQTAEQWAGIIDQCEQSDLNVKAFCEQNDLALSSFHKWHRRMRLKNYKPVPAFKEIKTAKPVIELAKPSSTVALNIGNNIVLSIQTDARPT